MFDFDACNIIPGVAACGSGQGVGSACTPKIDVSLCWEHPVLKQYTHLSVLPPCCVRSTELPASVCGCIPSLPPPPSLLPPAVGEHTSVAYFDEVNFIILKHIGEGPCFSLSLGDTT